MQTVNVKINIDSPTGRRLLKEVERHPKVAKVEYPFPEAIAGQRTYTLEESFDQCCNILSDHYGTNHKLIGKAMNRPAHKKLTKIELENRAKQSNADIDNKDVFSQSDVEKLTQSW